MGRFYKHKPLRFKDYSFRRIFISVALGLSVIVVFYLFQQYFFVLFRSIFIGFRFNANHLLSEDSGNLAAFVFAGNAVILGNSIGIYFLISRVSKTAIKRFRKLNVLNNQSFLIGMYYYLFVKVVVSMGILLMLLSNRINIINTWSIYTLLFVALFLESVKELRRSFKGYTVKVLLFHFFAILGLMFACILFNKSNYYKLGVVYNTSHPYVNIPSTAIEIPNNIYDYDVYNKLPISAFNRFERVPIKVISDSTRLIYKFHRETLSLDEVVNAPSNPKYTNSIRSHIEYDLTIYANHTIAYYRLKELENKAALRNISRIEYVIYSVENEREYTYVKNLYPTKALYENTEKLKPPPSFKIDYLEELVKDKKKEVLDLDSFIMKDKGEVDTKKVYSHFRKSVSDSVFFKLKITKEVTFQQYLDFMISYKQSVFDLREEQKLMNSALNDHTIKVKERYPIFIFDEIEE